MLPGDIIAGVKSAALNAERRLLEAILRGAAQRRSTQRWHRIGPGRRTVFTLERERYKRARSKYPYPHQSMRERTRAQRREMKEMLA